MHRNTIKGQETYLQNQSNCIGFANRFLALLLFHQIITINVLICLFLLLSPQINQYAMLMWVEPPIVFSSPALKAMASLPSHGVENSIRGTPTTMCFPTPYSGSRGRGVIRTVGASCTQSIIPRDLPRSTCSLEKSSLQDS